MPLVMCATLLVMHSQSVRDAQSGKRETARGAGFVMLSSITRRSDCPTEGTTAQGDFADGREFLVYLETLLEGSLLCALAEVRHEYLQVTILVQRTCATDKSFRCVTCQSSCCTQARAPHQVYRPRVIILRSGGNEPDHAGR